MTTYTGTFKWSGLDAEGGTLSGSYLHWSLREMGTSSWMDIGSGTLVTHGIQYQSGITWYIVRLEVFDSEGLMDSAEVEFRIQGQSF